MLKHLHIRNLATIDEMVLDFQSGFTTLTGETGAGKSILIDAISLVTGMRADSSLVRDGEEKAEVTADFLIQSGSTAEAWLQEAELFDADDRSICVIRRIVYAEGRTRAFINGNPVNAGQLRELASTLIEIFGQSESQLLLHQDMQRHALDEFGGHAKPLLTAAALSNQYRAIQKRIQLIQNASQRDPAQLDYLKAQIQELAALGLQENELETLENDHRRLSNTGRYLEEGTQTVELLYGGDSAIYNQLSRANALLVALASLDEQFKQPLEIIESAQTQVREAANHVSRLLDRMELDPAHLAQIEQRLSTIHDLSRKHRIKPKELSQHLAQMQHEYMQVESAADDLHKLTDQLNQLMQQYKACAEELHLKRLTTAKAYAKAISTIVRQLGMSNATFEVQVLAKSHEIPHSHGWDEVQFLFSANPGMPPKALAKIASGGELSRISLAMQVVGQQNNKLDTMIFDEIDAGIGGATADIVGQKLRMLGQNAQVLCVTHLAQVAAQSNHHFGIRKQIKAAKTYTQVTPLQDTARVEEIARMQGGVELTTHSLNHARDLLQRAAG